MCIQKNQEKIEKDAKKIIDLDFKQKQIASLGNNAEYHLKGRESRTTDPKEFYDIIQPETFTKLIQDRVTSDRFSTKHPKFYKNLSSAGTGLKSLNRRDLINQFYNDNPTQENRGTLEKLVNSLHPNATLKE
jgi:hypothetical protein